MLSFISAQLDDFAEGLEERVEGIEEGIEDVESVIADFERDRQEYLKKEWAIILERSQVGRVILSFSDVLENFSPIFKLFIGTEYSLSWVFFLSLALWGFVIFVVYFGLRGILDYDPLANFAVGVIIASLGAQLGVYQQFLDLISPLVTNKWIVGLSLIAAVIILYIYVKLSEIFGKYTKKTLEERKKLQRERAEDFREKKRDAELGIFRGIDYGDVPGGWKR